jgi:anti-sigma regulatory factor (Ser/Thr protein kinase)
VTLTFSTSEHFASFEAKNEPLEDIRVFVQMALLETPLPKKAIAGLMLAVEEAVTNILRHGYLYGPGRVRIRVRRTRRWVSIIISDTGRPYTMNVGDAPDVQQLADTGRRGGLGMYLIKRVTDHLDLQRVGDENVLTMSKRLHAGMRHPLTHSSMRKRVAWTGVLAVFLFVLAGAWIIERQATGRVTKAFYDHWSQFGRSAAAAASQHILNDRSDAEFDQLVVDLKAAHPGLDYLVILSELPLEDGTTDIRIRAHSESPEQVHEVYSPPEGVPVGGEGQWLVGEARRPEIHFAQHVRAGDRVVGAVVWGVPEATLSGSINSVLIRVGQWAGIALLGGWILVLVGATWTTKPIQKLVDTLRNSKSAGSEPESLMAEPEEIREVVAAFQEATESVAQTERQMAERDMQQRELEASRHLQRALMPQGLPEIDGYEFGARCRMARQVGGDYYDVLRLGDGRWLIIVADVAGKGLPAPRPDCSRQCI